MLEVKLLTKQNHTQRRLRQRQDKKMPSHIVVSTNKTTTKRQTKLKSRSVSNFLKSMFGKATKKNSIVVPTIYDPTSNFASIGGVYYDSSSKTTKPTYLLDVDPNIINSNSISNSNRERFGTDGTSDTTPTVGTEGSSSSDDDVKMTMTTNKRFAKSTKMSIKKKKWISSGNPGHHNDAPLFVLRSPSQRGSTYPTINDEEGEDNKLDDAELLGLIMQRSRKLPQMLGGKHNEYALRSNHIMVNTDRIQRIVQPLVRMKELDELATQHAKEMATNGELYQPKLKYLHDTILNNGRSGGNNSDNHQRIINRLGSNVACGESLLSMHQMMMTVSVADRNNILDRRFTGMGMGTAKSPTDGKLYLCQIFRG